MKATITITGQMNGNNTLKSYLNTKDVLEVTRTMFGGFDLEFTTVKEAKLAIKSAYKELKSDDPETSRLKKGSQNHCLYYDASCATIHKSNN